MAGGNWASSSFNNEGKSENCINYLGNSIQIYKSYALIESEKMWNDQCSFVKPVIAQIYEGRIKIAGFDIQTKRIKDPDGIFIFASYWKDETYQRIHFAGIGCYGWGDDGEWADVTPETERKFVEWLESFKYGCEEWKAWLAKVKLRTRSSMV